MEITMKLYLHDTDKILHVDSNYINYLDENQLLGWDDAIQLPTCSSNLILHYILQHWGRIMYKIDDKKLYKDIYNNIQQSCEALLGKSNHTNKIVFNIFTQLYVELNKWKK